MPHVVKVFDFVSRSLLSPRGFCLFWVVAAVVSVWGIDGGSLDTWDEALTGERAREMFRQGLSLTVYNLGLPDFNKPPLYYWLSAAGFSFFGLGELAVRLPSALMGLACTVVVYRLARSYGLDRNYGLFAAFLLAANPHWLNVSREGLLDSGMTLSMLLALWAYAFHPKHLHGAMWAGLALALGFWIKNPSVLLIVPALFVHSRAQEEPRYWRLFVVLAVALVVGSGWYVHQLFVWREEFFRFYFDYNIGKRFTHDFQGHRSAMDFYVRYLFEKSPHVLILIFGALFFYFSRILDVSKCVKVQAVFILIWIALIHTIHSKRDPYIVPIYPFVSLAGADFMFSLARKYRLSTKARFVSPVLILVCLITLVAHYNPRLDRNAAMLEGIDFMARNCRDSRFFVRDVPAHVPSFYLDRVVPVAQPGMPDGLGDACVLYNSKNNVDFMADFANATLEWSGKGGYEVWRLRPGETQAQ